MTTFLNHIKANSNALDAELTAVFAKYGIKVMGRTARVDAADGTYKFNISYATPEGSATKLKKDEENFRFYANGSNTNLNPDWFGKKFRSGVNVYKIVGYNPKKRAKPVMLDCNGKSYSASPDYVRSFMLSNPVA